MRGACMLMSQIDFIVSYFIVFEALQAGALQSLPFFAVVVCVALFCVLLHRILQSDTILDDLLIPKSVGAGKTVATILFYGYAFTPIIKTLSTSISTNTIYISSLMLFAVSLAFHDYGLDAPMYLFLYRFCHSSNPSSLGSVHRFR